MLGDLSEHGVYIAPDPLRGLFWQTGMMRWKGKTHPLHPSLVHDTDFAPAGDVLSIIHGWDHEIVHSN